MAGEYMNSMGSYPNYGMGPQQPFDTLGQYYQQQYQQRMQQMGQIPQQIAPYQANMTQQYRPQQPQGPGFTVRAATNVDECRATPVDLMSVNLFVNLAQGEIYVSRIDDNGLKDIKTYRLSVGDTEAPGASAKADVDLSEVFTRLDRIESIATDLKDQLA